MWPFDEEQITDSNVADFNTVARNIYEQSPDPETGLGALRDTYSSYDFEDKDKANQVLQNYSDQIKQRFEVRNKFNMNDTIEAAPINFDEVTGKGETEEAQKIDQINSWEKKNIEELTKAEDPIYIQNQESISSNIKKAATVKRREIYGTENNYIEDLSLRFAQGAADPLLYTVGAEDASNWFEEHTNPKNDADVLSQVAGGAGSAVGALTAGILTEGAGTAAYLVAQGGNAVEKKYNEAVDSGAPTGEALQAGAVEVGSQLIQTASGEKVIGGAARSILGQAERLGARVFPRIAEDAAIQGVSAGVSNIVSNEATNVGTGSNDSVLNNSGTSVLIGAIVGAGAGAVHSAAESVHGIREGYQNAKEDFSSSLGEPGYSPESREALDLVNLQNQVEAVDMQSPPPKEAVRNPITKAELDNPAVIATREDGTQLVKNDGRVHAQVGDSFAETHDNVFYVKPEVAKQLDELQNGHANDGTSPNIVSENGELKVQSDFLTDNLQVAPDKTSIKEKTIEAEKLPAPGLVDISASKVVHENGVRQVREAVIGSSPIKEVHSTGAAHINDLGYQESNYARRLRKTITDQEAEDIHLGTIKYESAEDGSISNVGFSPSLFKYMQTTNAEGGDSASKFIQENNVVGTLAYLDSLGDKASINDRYISTMLISQLRTAQFNARNAGDIKGARGYNELIAEAASHEARLASIGGSITQIGTDKAQKILGGNALTAESEVFHVQDSLQQQAEAEIAKEIGRPKVTLDDLYTENKAIDEKVDAIKKEINNPIEEAIAKDKAEIDRIHEEHTKRNFDEPIKKHESDIKDIEHQIHLEKENQINSLPEEAKAIQEGIDVHKQKLSDLQEEVKTRQEEKGKPPTEAQKKAIEKANQKIREFEANFNRVKKQNPIKSKPVKDLLEARSSRKRTIKKLREERNAPRELTPRQSQIQKRIETTRLNQTEGNYTTKSQRERLTDALKLQTVSKERISKAEQKIRDYLSKFPVEEQNRLRELYAQGASTKEPTTLLAIHNGILAIQGKHTPITPQSVDRLWNYWRANVLSSVETAARNSMGNFLNPAGTTLAYAATDLPKLIVGKSQLDFLGYTKGLYKGATGKGLAEAREVMAGRRGGRLTAEGNTKEQGTGKELPTVQKVEPYKWVPLSKVGPLTIPNPGVYLMNITNFMSRGLGAADAIAHAGSKEGQAYMAAFMTDMQGKNLSFREKMRQVEQGLYGTEDFRKLTNERLDAQVESLKKLGVTISPNERKLMFYEAMENNRSEYNNKVANRHGDTNTFMNVPHNSAFGLLARGINYGTARWVLRIGKDQIAPGKEIFPFLNTAANIADNMLSYTPMGIGHALEIQYRRSDLRAKGKEDIYKLEAREHFGKMIVGTAMTASLAAVLNHYSQDKDPFIAFYGATPKGDAKKWQSQNIKEFSLKIGDNIIPKEALGPALLAFVLADNISKAKNSKQDLGTTAYNTVVGFMGAMSKSSYLKSVGDIFESFQGSEPIDENASNATKERTTNAAKSLGANYLQGFIPAVGFLKNVYKWYDGSPQETFNNFSAKLLNNIPFGTELTGAKKKLNMFGEVIKYDMLDRSPVGTMISSKNDDPVFKWLTTSGYKVTDIGPTVALTKPEKDAFSTLREQNHEYKDILDPEESSRVLSISGPQIKQYLQNVMQQPYFSVYSEAGQKAINENINKIRAEARMRVLTKRY